MSDPQGFTITPNRLSYALSLIALCGTLYTGVSYVVRVEARQSNLEIANERLSTEVAKLSEAVSSLALSLKEVEVIQRQAPRALVRPE